jgi:putative nucleotide binding protein
MEKRNYTRRVQNVDRNLRNKEEKAVVLDFLPNGYPFDNTPSHRKNSIVQAIGKERFLLLELVPKKEAQIQPGEEIYIGDGKREKIHHILGRLDASKMTRTAEEELKFVIEKMIKKNEERFVEFFNNARPLTTRMHQLELLPGLGKKHMWEIIEERRVEPFKSFEDVKKRVKLMPDPKKIILTRIIKEITGKEKHNLFVG